jgi:hypothetical protein
MEGDEGTGLLKILATEELQVVATGGSGTGLCNRGAKAVESDEEITLCRQTSLRLSGGSVSSGDDEIFLLSIRFY